tara:strand:- start:596 stop:3103 length:2508 start_codon:yes stop_codon:yes gene_type:complete
MSAAPTKQLTSTDILSKMQAGQPLYQGEKLPDVPKGMSAKGFYGQFPGGASVYSQAPFKQATYGTYSPSQPVSEFESQPTTPTETVPATSVTTDSVNVDDTFQGDSGISDSDIQSQLDQLTLPSTDDLLQNISGVNVDFSTELENLKSILDPDEYANAYNNLSAKIAQARDDVLNNLQTSGTDAVNAAKEHLQDFENFLTDDPFGKVANIFVNEWSNFTNALENLTTPDTYQDGLSYFGEKFAKTSLSAVFGQIAQAVGLGAFAGPLGGVLANVVWDADWEATQIGKEGVSYDNDDTHSGTGEKAAIAGFDKYGIARDNKGRQVFTYNNITHRFDKTNLANIKSIVTATEYLKLSSEEKQKNEENFVRGLQFGGSDIGGGYVVDDEDDPLGMKGAEAILGDPAQDIMATNKGPDGVTQGFGGDTNIGPDPEDDPSGMTGAENILGDPTAMTVSDIVSAIQAGMGESVSTKGNTVENIAETISTYVEQFELLKESLPNTNIKEDDDPAGMLGAEDILGDPLGDPDMGDEDNLAQMTMADLHDMLIDASPVTAPTPTITGTIGDDGTVSVEEEDDFDAELATDTGAGTGYTGEKASTADFTTAEAVMLAQIIDAEARGESKLGKEMVAQVVVNRTGHVKGEWKNMTPAQIMAQKNAFAISTNKPSPESIAAAAKALANGRQKEGKVFFLNPELTVAKHGHQNLHSAIAPYFDKSGKQIASIPPAIAVRVGKHLFSKYIYRSQLPEHLKESPQEIANRGKAEAYEKEQYDTTDYGAEDPEDIGGTGDPGVGGGPSVAATDPDADDDSGMSTGDDSGGGPGGADTDSGTMGDADDADTY